MTVTLDELLIKFPYLNKSTVYKATAKKKFPHFKPHRKLLLFDTDEVERHLRSNRVLTNEDLLTQVMRENNTRKPK